MKIEKLNKNNDQSDISVRTAFKLRFKIIYLFFIYGIKLFQCNKIKYYKII